MVPEDGGQNDGQYLKGTFTFVAGATITDGISGTFNVFSTRLDGGSVSGSFAAASCGTFP